MSEPGSYHQSPGPAPYASPYPPYPSDSVAASRSGPSTAMVVAGIGLGLSLLVGLVRWAGSLVNVTTDSFLTWPFATLPVVVEVVLALVGFAGAVAALNPPHRRGHGAYLLLAAAAAVLGFAVSDGLYQLLTLVA